jgi:hypothetical protein
MINQHRDTYATMLAYAQFPMLVGTIEGESIARTRYNLLQRMIEPCGRPPKEEDLLALRQKQKEAFQTILPAQQQHQSYM